MRTLEPPSPGAVETVRHHPRHILLILAAQAAILIAAFALPAVDSLAGPAVPLRLLVEILATAALVLTAVGLGAWLVSSSGLSRLPFHHLVACLVVGMGALGSLFLLVGWLGHLNRTMVFTLTALASVVGVIRLPVVLGGIRRCLAAVVALTRKGHGLAAVAVHGLLATLLIIVAVAPSQDWDTLMYHLSAPLGYLDAGRVDVPDDNFHFAFVGPIHLFYVCFFSFGVSLGPRLLATTSVLLIIATVGATCWRLSGTRAAVTGSVATWSMTGLVLISASASPDAFLILALGVATALVALAVAEEKPLLIGPVALIVGVALSTKYSAGPYVLGLVLAVAVTVPLSVPLVRFVARYSAVGLGLWAIWLLKNQWFLGSPFYPFLVDRQAPRWMTALPNHDRLASVTNTYAPLTDVRRPFDLVRWVTNPQSLTVEASGAKQGLSLLLFAPSVFSAFVLARPLFMSLAIPAFVHAAGIVAIRPETNLRYLLPVTVSLGVLTGLVLGRRWQGPLGRGLLVAVLAIAITPTVLHLGGRAYSDGDLAYATGFETFEEWSGRDGNHEAGRLASLNRMLDGVHPERVLLLFEAREAAISHKVIQDNDFKNWALIVNGSGDSCFSAQFADTVVVSVATLDYLIGRGLDPVSIHWDQFSDFADRCLTLLETSDGFAVYTVK